MAENNKVVLGILSACSPQYVFVGKGKKVLSSLEINYSNGGNKTLSAVVSCLERAKMTIQDVDFFLALSGPGSLTGIRTGLSPIRAWGYALNKPVMALPTCDVMTHGIIRPVVAIIPSRTNEYWVQTFTDNMSEVPMIISASSLDAYDIEGYTWMSPKELSPTNASFVLSSPKPEQALELSLGTQAQSWMRALPKYLFEMEA
ncbi:MAG: hypothetical protein ABFD23_03045 [Caldisericales bacterium]|nr:hypothetical protein [bacterium]